MNNATRTKFSELWLTSLDKMNRSLVNGAVKGRMSIMLIANFVILRSDVIMLESTSVTAQYKEKTH